MNPIVVASLCAAFALSTTACDRKVEECNALVKVLNTAQDKLNPAGVDAAAFEKLAGQIDQAAVDVGKAVVKLPELQKFRDSYTGLLQDTAKGARDAAEGAKAADMTKLGAAAKALTEMGTKVSKLTEEINQFCSAK